MKKLINIFFFLTLCLHGQNVKYATVSGNSGNTGNSEAQAWTLSYALDQLAPGMELWVKAGNYGALQKNVSVNGTSSQSIKIIGYKTNPGDIIATDGTTLYTGGLPDVAESPVLMGTTSTNRPNQDRGLMFASDWIEIKNIAFYSYNQPFEIVGDNNKIDNVYSYKAGNHNPPDLGGFGTSFPTGPYTGWGIRISGNNHLLTNSYVLDAGAEGIKTYNSNNFVHRNNTVETKLGVGSYYGDPTQVDGNSTDYHYLTAGTSTGGRFYDIKVIQKKGIYSDGHGIIFKSSNSSTPITDMIVDGFYVMNSKIETQFPNVGNITFKNGTMDTNDDGSRRAGKEANIANASYNVRIENVVFKNATHFTSRGWNDIYNEAYDDASVDCKVVNCHFEGVNDEQAIWITHGPGNADGWTTRNLTFDHCTFDNYTRLAYMSADFENVQFKNCIINDIANYYVIGYHDGPGGQGGTGGPYPLTATFTSTNFFGGFSAQAGTGITTLDPQLVGGKSTNSTLLTSGVATDDYVAGISLGYFGAFSIQPRPILSTKEKSILSTILIFF